MEAEVIEVDDQNFDQKVLQPELPVVVDFWAPWCGPCRAVSPIIEKLVATHGDRVQFAKLNIDDNARIAQKFGIKSVPTILFFNNGEMVDKLVGLVTMAKLEERLENLLAGKPTATPFIVQ